MFAADTNEIAHVIDTSHEAPADAVLFFGSCPLSSSRHMIVSRVGGGA